MLYAVVNFNTLLNIQGFSLANILFVALKVNDLFNIPYQLLFISFYSGPLRKCAAFALKKYIEFLVQQTVYVLIYTYIYSGQENKKKFSVYKKSVVWKNVLKTRTSLSLSIFSVKLQVFLDMPGLKIL